MVRTGSRRSSRTPCRLTVTNLAHLAGGGTASQAVGLRHSLNLNGPFLRNSLDYDDCDVLLAQFDNGHVQEASSPRLRPTSRGLSGLFSDVLAVDTADYDELSLAKASSHSCSTQCPRH